MWEERMGGGGSGGGGGGGGGGRGDGRDEAARRAAAERLRERYRSIEEAKRSREIVVEGGPARPGKQPRTAAGGRPNLVQHKRAAGGGGPLAAQRPPAAAAAARRPNGVLSKLKQQAHKVRQ